MVSFLHEEKKTQTNSSVSEGKYFWGIVPGLGCFKKTVGNDLNNFVDPKFTFALF